MLRLQWSGHPRWRLVGNQRLRARRAPVLQYALHCTRGVHRPLTPGHYRSSIPFDRRHRTARHRSPARHRQPRRASRLRRAADAPADGPAAFRPPARGRCRAADARARRSASPGSWPRWAPPSSSSARSCRRGGTCCRPSGPARSNRCGDAPRVLRDRRARPGRSRAGRPARAALCTLRGRAAGHRIDRADAPRPHPAGRRGGGQGAAAGHRAHDARRPGPALPGAQLLEAGIDEMQLVGVVAIVEEFEQGLLGELDSTRNCPTCASSRATSTPRTA